MRPLAPDFFCPTWEQRSRTAELAQWQADCLFGGSAYLFWEGSEEAVEEV